MRVSRVFFGVMRIGTQGAASGGRRWRSPLVLACALALACASALACALALAESAPANAAGALSGASSAQAPAVLASAAANGQGATAGNFSATLEQCVTSSLQAERSATFIGEMTAISGAGRMSIRIELQERTPGEPSFRTVSAPGLGVWRGASSGVKVYRYIKQVTDLAAPAAYRAAVRFRWLNARGKLIRSVERHTATCVQPVPVAAASTTGAAG
jgi:hypothetical protein